MSIKPENNSSKLSFNYIIGYGSVILIVLGYVKFEIVYSYFHLNILEYIDIGEFISLNIFVIISGIVFLILIYSIPTKVIKYEKPDNFKAEIIFRIKHNKNGLIWTSIFGMIPIIAYILLCFGIEEVEELIILTWSYIFYPIYLFSLCVILPLLDAKSYQIYSDNRTYIWFAFCAILLTFMIASIKIHDIKYRPKTVSFYHDQKYVSSTPDSLYVGQTAKYLFMYKISEDRPIVFSRVNVDNFSYYPTNN